MGIFRNWRRRRVLKQSLVDIVLWQQTVAALPLLTRLTNLERERLRELVTLFLHEKEISGANDFVPDNFLCITIAAQACLPILYLGIDSYNDWISVVVYPEEFLARHEFMDEAGVVHVVRDIMRGEAWLKGPLILSGRDAMRSGALDGINVVIHECAHKLDMLNGDANGFPPLHRGMNAAEWSRVFSAAYEDLCRRVDAGHHTAIDPYATENPGEFFAVLSEVFFEMPVRLRQSYPSVYEQMTAFYRQDPARNDS